MESQAVKTVTKAQAARWLSLSEHKVSGLIEEGVLVATKHPITGRVQVTLESIQKLINDSQTAHQAEAAGE